MTSLDSTVKYYIHLGLSVKPLRLDGSKAPAIRGREPQHRIPTQAEIEQWFSRPAGIGIMCGAVSGGLEVLDVEDSETASAWEALMREVAPEVLDRLPVARTGGGGRHYYYRCGELREHPQAGRKLALRREHGRNQVIIETRGEGQYVVAPGSPAEVHSSGRPYEWIGFPTPAIEDIPTLTREERDAILQCARALDETGEVNGFSRNDRAGGREAGPRAAKRADGEPTPIERINAEADEAAWESWLLADGWTLVYRRGEVSYWRRPGKTEGGISATLGACRTRDDQPLFYVFSTNAPIEPRCYDAAGYLAHARYGGDFRRMIRQEAGDRETSGVERRQAGDRQDEEHRYDALGSDELAELEETGSGKLSVEDFYAEPEDGKFIYRATRRLWPAVSVDARVPPIPIIKIDGRSGKEKESLLKASAWIRSRRAVDGRTWAPGEPEVIEDKLLIAGGWSREPGRRMYNLYIPPREEYFDGDPDKAGNWIGHLERIYPNDFEYIISWLAFKIQNPGRKINHGLVLGGPQGCGKDTALAPVKRAIGAWNFSEATPTQLMGRFNDHLQAVILRISEARDLGEVNRYAFYDHLKIILAAPPETLRINRKFEHAYEIPNVVGVIITTNQKHMGIYLPPDDRRHYVAWSEVDRRAFDESYWEKMWNWYKAGGFEHVAAYLRTFNWRGGAFDPKKPPAITEAWREIVDSNVSSQNYDLADLLEEMGEPPVISIPLLAERTRSDKLREILEDPNRGRWIAARLDEAGYSKVYCPTDRDGRWHIGHGRKLSIYGLRRLPEKERQELARAMAQAEAGTA